MIPTLKFLIISFILYINCTCSSIVPTNSDFQHLNGYGSNNAIKPAHHSSFTQSSPSHRSLSALNPALVEPDYELPINILILTVSYDESTYPVLGAATTALSNFGIPYTIHRVLDREPGDPVIDPIPIGLPDLEDSGTDTPYFSGIVLVDGVLGYSKIDTSYQSALSSSDWDDLYAFAIKYSIRTATLFHYPNAQPGIQSPPDGISDDSYLKWHPQGYVNSSSILNGLNPDGTYDWAVNEVWRYECAHIPVTPGLDTIITPLLLFHDESLAAAHFIQHDGRHEIQFYFVLSSYTQPGQFLAHVWVPWITNNVYQGERRIYFNLNLHSVFTPTPLWNPATNSTFLSSELSPQRVTDFSNFISTLSTLQSSLPTGSTFKPTLGLSGSGSAAQSDSLWAQLSASSVRDLFYWTSSGWEYMDLACPNSDCGSGSTLKADAISEISNNIDFATDLFGGSLSTASNWDGTAYILPFGSGLDGTNGGPTSLEALFEAGIKYIISDNSNSNSVSATPYYALNTTDALHGQSGLIIIPSQLTRIFFDCTDEECNVAKHTYQYGPDGITPDANQIEQTMEAILSTDKTNVMAKIISLRKDLFTLHQSNLIEYSGTSLAERWLSHMISSFNDYVSEIPLLSTTPSQLAQLYIEREQRDACNVTISLTFKDNSVTNVTATSIASAQCTTSVSALVTGLTRPSDISWPGDITIISYGLDTILSIPLSPGESRTIAVEQTNEIRTEDEVNGEESWIYCRPDECQDPVTYPTQERCWDMWGTPVCYDCNVPDSCHVAEEDRFCQCGTQFYNYTLFNTTYFYDCYEDNCPTVTPDSTTDADDGSDGDINDGGQAVEDNPDLTGLWLALGAVLLCLLVGFFAVGRKKEKKEEEKSDIKAKKEEEKSDIKAKKEEEIGDIKAKKEEEIDDIKAKTGAKKADGTLSPRAFPVVSGRKTLLPSLSASTPSQLGIAGLPGSVPAPAPAPTSDLSSELRSEPRLPAKSPSRNTLAPLSLIAGIPRSPSPNSTRTTHKMTTASVPNFATGLNIGKQNALTPIHKPGVKPSGSAFSSMRSKTVHTLPRLEKVGPSPSEKTVASHMSRNSKSSLYQKLKAKKEKNKKLKPSPLDW